MSSAGLAEHFSLHNIPFGIASSQKHSSPQAVTRVNNNVIFLGDLMVSGLFHGIDGLPDQVFQQDTLNAFAALGCSLQRAVRERIQQAVGKDGLASYPPESQEHLDAVSMHLPVYVGDFVDCSCSGNHVRNAGRIINQSEQLPPIFFNAPLAYQGRAGSIVVSGTDIQRPNGLRYSAPASSEPPPRPTVVYAASERVDYELELAAIVGKPIPMRSPLKPQEVDDHIFGFVVMNDWSARDIQGLEMTPLGPFNGKSFATSISPWVITVDALRPFRVVKTSSGGSTAAYLHDPESVTFDITMQVEIVAAGGKTTLGSSQVQDLYWTPRQMIAHSVSSGSALRTGDIISTGTVSGFEEGTYGCLLEATEGGTKPIALHNGATRTFLLDGDTVRMTAFAGGVEAGVGFGECIGTLLPSRRL
ncbi:hypothetical protein S40288_10149 [Stachybotrys chartarum IBT 40288]|nr:hypothetical protein S40288_10149 [Stachybotrys chartarum IBT 40288]